MKRSDTGTEDEEGFAGLGNLRNWLKLFTLKEKRMAKQLMEKMMKHLINEE